METTPANIVVIGTTCRDTIILADGAERQAIGGKAYYTALALQSLEVPPFVVTWVADADRELLAPYRERDIPLTNIAVPTSVAYTDHYMDTEGNIREQHVRVPQFTLSLADFPEIALTAIANAAIVYLGTDLDTVVTETFLQQLRTTTRARFAIDLGTFFRHAGPDGDIQYAAALSRQLPYALLDIGVLSMEDVPVELRTHSPQSVAKHFQTNGIREMLVTAGSAGCVIATVDGTTPIPAVSADIVAPTGAGDTFIAGYLAEHLRSEHTVHCAQFATAAAACAIQTYEPLQSTRNDIMKLLTA